MELVIASAALRERCASMRAFRKSFRHMGAALLCAGAVGVFCNQARASESYTLFEAGQVRPLALSPSGRLLLAVNTPDARLEIFLVAHRHLVRVESVPVGLEPVAVAVRGEQEAWVVNHVSDSVSVVKVGPLGLGSRVERSLLVGS
jgi:hypothetical protein